MSNFRGVIQGENGLYYNAKQSTHLKFLKERVFVLFFHVLINPLVFLLREVLVCLRDG